MRFARLAVILVTIPVTVLVAGQQEFQLKVNVSLVSVDVGVYDRKGDAVTTLRKDDFLVYEDDQLQEIRAFEPSGVAFNALLVVDRSGSMRGAWDSMVSGLNRFMGVLRAQDRVAIAAFDSDDRDGLKMAKCAERAPGTGRQSLRTAEARIFTALMVWAAGYIKGEKGRKGVIVFSDGKQSGGFGDSINQALERVRQVNVPFYFVGYNTDPKGALGNEAARGRVWRPGLLSARR